MGKRWGSIRLLWVKMAQILRDVPLLKGVGSNMSYLISRFLVEEFPNSCNKQEER